MANNKENSQPEVVFISPDEVLKDLCDKDPTVEIRGYVAEIFRPQEVGQARKYQLFKFVLATKGCMKITCLVWGTDLIQQYQHEITSNRILHIDGALSKAATLSLAKIEDNFAPFELIIQNTTVVTYHGDYGQVREQTNEPPTETTLANIHKAKGLVITKGFIKMKFVSQTNRYDNASYGKGSITDGTIKVNVIVANYSPMVYEKGTAVIVKGEIDDKNGFVGILCKNSSDIILDEKNTKVLSAEVLCSVNRTPKREIQTE